MQTRDLIRQALGDFRASWRALALADLAYKLVAFSLLTPATVLLLQWAMSRAGTAVIADVEIATFFLTTRPGIAMLVIGGAIIVATTALEMACLMAIGLSAASGRRLQARTALAFGASRAAATLRLSGHIVVRLLGGLVPFAAAIGLVYWTLLRPHDINFYLAERPPAFVAAAAIAAVLVAGLAAVLVRALARWALALPLVLFEGVSPRRALAESARRSAGMRATTIAILAAWAAVATVLAAVAGALPAIVGRSLAPLASGSLGGLLAFIAALVVLWAVLSLCAAVVDISLLSLGLTRLYLHAGGSLDGRLTSMASSDAGGPAGFPRALRIPAAIVVVFAAAGATLLMTGSARRDQRVLTIAHRGASAEAPENTMAAFRLAADQGADFIELDVQESADGEVLVVHDSDLMKVGGFAAKIWDASAAELRAVDIGSYRGPEFARERVPTLAEVFEALKGRARVIVELKSYGHAQRLEERVVEIVEAAGVERDTVFMSLDHEMVRRMKALRPSWRVGALVAKAIGDVTSIGGDFLAVEAGLATRRFVRQAHRAGQDVYVWTVNDPAWMLSAMSRGVDGLITDKPDLARRVIDQRASMSDAQRLLVALLVAFGAETDALAAETALQPYTLAARASLAAGASRAGSPASGAFFTAEERATAAANGIVGPAEGPYLSEQPLQGFSSMVPADERTWWALADNGFGRRANSADFQLVIHRVDPRWGDPNALQVLETIVVRDPDRHLTWRIACDPEDGTALPDFSFNATPDPPPACGDDPAARILTGFDLDPESFVRAPDGTFWVSEEFGPFLVHVAADGRVLAPPVEIPGVRSPQNPFLDIADRRRAERPTLSTSRGFEGLAISPDGSTLYALLEGAVTGDDPHDLRIYLYDMSTGTLQSEFLKVRLEASSQAVDLASLIDSSGTHVYPDAVAPAPGPVAIGELKAVNDHQMLLIERDNHGDDLSPPVLKKVFLLDLSASAAQDGYVGKKQIVDLLTIPDPDGLGGDTPYFRLPFQTIESVHVADERTILVAVDNNFPFSNGRARSAGGDRTGPLAADATEMVLIRFAVPLEVDRRLLPGGR